MSVLVLVVVGGPPASGKSTLARRISAEFGLPFISKDGVKESLYDTLGCDDRAWSQRLGMASMRLLYYFAEAQLAVGRSCIVESNFTREYSTADFLALRAKYEFKVFQIQCQAQGEILLRRFKERVESGDRHPGHVDHTRYDELTPVLLKGRYEPLEIGGELAVVDTTDPPPIGYGSLCQAIRSALGRIDVA
jgi:predicted kinase